MTYPILTVMVGSHAHGIATENSDVDYVSIQAAPLESTLGVAPVPKTQSYRTAPAGVRSRADDTEHTTYELRHFAALAAQGNPSMLLPLFVHPEHVVTEQLAGRELRQLAPAFVSRKALHRHLGYLDAQRARMTGQGPHQSRKPNRPELVQAHGYDTKYAAQALRLGWQGVELAETGRLTLPMPEHQQQVLKSLRAGEVSEAEALALIDQARADLAAYVNGEKLSDLSAEPDFGRINAWLIDVQTRELRLGVDRSGEALEQAWKPPVAKTEGFRWSVDGGVLCRDGEPTGVTVQSRDEATTVFFRHDGRGIASYSGMYWSTAVLRFARTHMGDQWASVQVATFSGGASVNAS